MLQVRYSRQRNEIAFLLEQPLPSTLVKHDGLTDFLQVFCSSGGEVHRTKDGALAALTIKIDRWRTCIARALPAKEAQFHLDTLDNLVATQKREQTDEGLEINFHQKSFDTATRYWRFILEQGNFSRYFFNRVGWFMAPVNRLVTPFPLHVDIETASTCNMNCPMCYRGMLSETGQMDPVLYRRIVDECAEEGVFSIRLSWRGETLTHPDIKELIAYACKRIPSVSFLTNAFYIDDSMSTCLIENGVSYVAVSFDGIGEVYEKIRAPAKYMENRARLLKLKQLREAAGARRPQVRLCTIWPAIKDDPEAYYKAMSPVSDYIVYNPYINFTGPMSIKPDFICQYPWERLVVAHNGESQCCTGWNATDIVLGNAREQSLKSMWLSPEMENIRAIHATGCRMKLESCAACRHGSKGESDVNIDEILARRW